MNGLKDFLQTGRLRCPRSHFFCSTRLTTSDGTSDGGIKSLDKGIARKPSTFISLFVLVRSKYVIQSVSSLILPEELETMCCIIRTSKGPRLFYANLLTRSPSAPDFVLEGLPLVSSLKITIIKIISEHAEAFTKAICYQVLVPALSSTSKAIIISSG